MFNGGSPGRENMQQGATWQANQENQQPQLKVLVVDDEDNIIELIRLGLRYEGFQVEVASDGEQGIALAQRIDPDLIILDVMMPGIDGLEVGRRILGLQTGADDYLTKPFDFYELLERIKAILRRQSRSKSLQGDANINDATQILQFGDLRMNTSTREVIRHEQAIELTATE